MTAMAINTRCACPTLICEGYLRRKSWSEGKLTLVRAARIARSQSLPFPFACARQASFNCVRILSAGFNDESGLCKTSAGFRPRRSRNSRSLSRSRSTPSNSIVPCDSARFLSSNPRIAIARVLFPDPLCPTNPKISPARISISISRNTGLAPYRIESRAARTISVAIKSLYPVFSVSPVLKILTSLPRPLLRQPLRIPKCLWRQDHRNSPMHSGRYCRKSILVDQIDKGSLLHHDLLHSIETFFSFLDVAGRSLRSHQLVDLRFPGCLRRFFLRIPLVVLRGAQPHVHLLVRVQIHIRQAQQNRLIIEGLRHALDQRREVQCYDIDVDTDLLQIVLNQNGHALAIFVPGVRNDGKDNRVALVILECAILHAESRDLQCFQRGIGTVRFRLKPGIEPE